MLDMKNQKTKPVFNHMELNIYKGLNDIPTLTELAVLAMYYLSVTGPYAVDVQGPGKESLDMLDLRPLYECLKEHIQKLICSPSLALRGDQEPSHKDATFGGREWLQPRVVSAIYGMQKSLPHLSSCFVAFLKGALTTWEHFTLEFKADGIIAKASAEEKKLAFMPATNDANEGTLRMWQKWVREKEQHGEEKKRRAEHSTYLHEKAWITQEKVASQAARAAKWAEILRNTELVTDWEVVQKMMNKLLYWQLELWCKVDKQVQQTKKGLTTKQPMLKEIKAAIDQMHNDEGSDPEDALNEEPAEEEDEDMD
ncbi:hypothetical protein Moror_11130 [Moniliophthora roreri MCA 2997]|uniref:Uncharacterized protein n=1 Tax=Moniliophthora roreri (strain MCA 2997) TaxID=1381753 RepID=V2WJ40_MONRO|nr:hypothetical protein Moror_11130 [Moniliophthora roreri MCA 2997]